VNEEKDHTGINSEKKESKKSKKKKKKSLKGLLSDNKTGQMIFKTSLRNHLDLSSLADSKASTMLSINSLIITFALPLSMTYVSDKPILAVPIIILLVTCLTSITFATLVTRPHKMKGKTDLKTINEGAGDLFFFGNFFKMSFEDYLEGVKIPLSDEDKLDQSIVRDLYSSGKALGIKYQRLRICYSIFIVGLIIAAVSFLIVVQQ